MGPVRRVGPGSRQLSRQANRPREFARTSADRLECKSVIRIDIVAETSGAERARNRLRKRTRQEWAGRPLVRLLFWPRSAAGRGRRARLKLPPPLHHPFDERAHRPAGNERKFSRLYFFTSRLWTIARLT